jgi:site-specific recombinase XerD
MIELHHEGKLIRYRPAELTKGKSDWYIHYSAPDPLRDKNKLYRKRIKLNHIKSKKERVKYAHFLCDQINRKLRNGWNPWLEEQAPKGNTTLAKAIQTFLSRKEKEGLRPDSIRSYTSKSKQLTDWLSKNGNVDMVSAAFTPYHAREFMEAVLDGGASATTYNNTITFGKVLFNWLRESQYCVIVPFDRIKPLKRKSKRRKIIPTEWREKVRAYLAEHDPDFLRSCMLQFYAQVRPAEQTRLMLANVNMEQKVIYIPGNAAKTGQGRYVTIPDALMPYMHEIPWDRIGKHLPLVGKSFAPGAKKLSETREWTRTWRKMGAAIGLPMEYQFYSLRDSGIVYMIEQGVPLNLVMQQAGHADLHTTSKYVKHANVKRVDQIGDVEPGF